MNVEDFLEKIRAGDTLMNKDRWLAAFERQAELMEKYHVIEASNGLLQTEDVPVDLNDKMGQARLKDFAWRITEELGEAMNCLKNKPWKQTHMQTNQTHYKEEIADAFHFMLELCILSGLGPDELFQMYMAKAEVNTFRQGSNY